jgi:hypothetical protein
MDDLPVPQGSWQAQHNSNQTKYNIHLIGGIAFLTFTLTFVSTCRLFFCGGKGDNKTLPSYKILFGFFAMTQAMEERQDIGLGGAS